MIIQINTILLYGKHFLVTSESNIEAVITKIQGNIDVPNLSYDSSRLVKAMKI